MTEKRPSPNKGRSLARHLALLATYQWLMTEDDPHSILGQFTELLAEGAEPENFLEGEVMSDVDADYFARLFTRGIESRDEVMRELDNWLDRPLVQIDPVEQSILQVAGYELKFELDAPYKVVINEAVELTKRFGAEDSFKYINAVMDKAAKQWRKSTVQQ